MWFNCQGNGKLGRLDPRDGSYRLIDLGPGSAPHGVIVGPDRAAWVTDGGQNAIVRVDNDHKVTVFKLPIKDYTNLNTAAFDKSGIYWFTGQSGYHGRLDPKSGDIQVFKSPGGRGSYGMTVTPKGDIWYASLAGNHIAKIDLKSGNAKMVEPITPNQGARRVWSDSKGHIWVSEWNSGNVSVHNPDDGSWRTWRLPGQQPAHLFGLCRRQGQGLAHRFRRQRDRALRPGDGEVQRVPERQAERQCAPDGRQAGPGLGRRVRHQPAGDDRDARAAGMIRGLAALLLLLWSGAAVADDGSTLFEPCRACHSLDPAARTMPGPNLAGLIGRKVAGDERFDYSPVLRQAREQGWVWTVEALEMFLADPEAMFPAMWMSASGIRDMAGRKALARFIADPASR